MEYCCEPYSHKHKISDTEINAKHDLYPLFAGEQSCRPKHNWGPGIRPYYLVHYVISGKGMLYSGTNKYCLSQGDMFFAFPHTIVKYQADKDDPWHYIWLSFSGEEARELLSSSGINLSNPVIHFSEPTELLALMRSMPESRSENRAENLNFSAMLYRFMSLVLQNTNYTGERDVTYFSTAVRFINSHFCEPLTVEDLAAFVGINRKYLYSIFMDACGKSPKEYIIDYRIKKACEFLHEDTLSISNIAYSVGYADPLMFSKMFKSKMRMSPSEYRKLINNS